MENRFVFDFKERERSAARLESNYLGLCVGFRMSDKMAHSKTCKGNQ